MTNFSRTGSLPYSYCWCPGTLSARELLDAYRRYDDYRDLCAATWLIRWLIPRTWRQWHLNLLEAKTDVLHWGGRL